MSAVERIQAAIDKLTELKAASTPPTDGPAWRQGRADHLWERTSEVYTGPDASADGSADVVLNSAPADAELIVTLHGTIDPLLEAFRGAVRYMEATGDEAHDLLLAIADAILGPDSH